RSGDLQKRHVVHIPAVGEAIEYGQIPEHVSSRRQEQLIEYQTNSEVSEGFEVEVIAEVEGAWLRIPEEIVEGDPRWQILADTGILKARWDRNSLKLTSFTQHDLIIDEAKKRGENCCARCVYFQGRCCQCEDSPMCSLQVDPSGYCPEFFPSQSDFYISKD
ncbi:MAG: MBL fold metallo-hydrolase, partial [Symploca sp. SIO2B6]|nr:MBL fold metallo-hydrolase [Symploca sp. SIO2B6]